MAGLTSGILGGARQRPDAEASRAPVHQHLGNVGAMGLVLELVEPDLDGADDAARILGDQQDAAASAGSETGRALFRRDPRKTGNMC